MTRRFHASLVSSGRRAISVRSCPAENTGPRAAMTMQRISSSSYAVSSEEVISASMALDNGLR